MSEIRERSEPDGSRSIMFRTTILVWGPLLVDSHDHGPPGPVFLTSMDPPRSEFLTSMDPTRVT
jgi:hypothetical protein